MNRLESSLEYVNSKWLHEHVGRQCDTLIKQFKKFKAQQKNHLKELRNSIITIRFRFIHISEVSWIFNTLAQAILTHEINTLIQNIEDLKVKAQFIAGLRT